MQIWKNKQLPLLSFLLFLLFLLIPWLALAEGDGIKIGEKGKFHPALFINAGFDSNVLNRSSQSTNPSLSQILMSPYVNIRPGLKLNLPTSPVGLYLAGYLNYSLYFLTANLNQFTGKADLDVLLFQDSIVSFTLSNYFSRGIGDPYTATEVFDRVKFYFNSGAVLGPYLTWNNLSRARLSIKPGGGVLQIDLDYEFQFGIYPNTDIDNHRHNINLNAKWKFFPKTAVFIEGMFSVINYVPGAFAFGSQSGINANMMPFKVYLGISGQFTPRFVLLARVGGGYTNSDKNDPRNKQYNGLDDYGMVIGSLEAGYFFTPTSVIRVGFRHDFSDSGFANYYHETIGYLSLSVQFNQFLITLRGDAGYVGYGKISTTLPSIGLNAAQKNADGTINRGDVLVRGVVGFDWNIKDWLAVGVEGRVVWRNSNTFIVDGSDQIGMSYFKFEGGLKVNLAF